MADECVSQNSSKNPDPQEKPVSGDDITPSQEQQALPDRLPQSLIEWLARINRRYLAFETKKAAILALAENTINSQARNMLLSDYLLMTGQVETSLDFGDPKEAFRRIDDNVVPLMPMDTLHRIMAVNLNASKSMETDMVVGLQLTDIKQNDPNAPDHYTLNVRKGILEVDPPSASEGQFEIVTDSLTWKQLVLAKLDPEDAVANGKVVISGGTPESFYAFMDLFDYE